MVVGVRPAGIVEARDIGQQAAFKLLNGLEAAPVELLFFQILEKALHNGVVIGVAFGGKGLDYAKFIDCFSEISGSKLRTLIRVKDDAFGDAPQPHGVPQGVDGQEAVDFTSDPAGNDLSGKKVQNGTDVIELSANLYVGKVADPHKIRGFLVKSLGKDILAGAGILLAFRRFGRLHSAHFGQPHLFHQPVHPTLADGYAMLPRKTEGHLFNAQPFVSLDVDLQDPLADLHVFLLPPGGLPPPVLVIGAAVDPQHPAEDGDGMLAGQGVDGFQSLSECGVNIAIAFFKMRFSSSNSALRF